MEIDWEDWDIEEEDPYILGDFKGHEDFYYFLVKNEILDEYKTNFHISFNSSTTLKDFLRITDKYNYITTGFNWDLGIGIEWINYHHKC